VVVSSSSPSSPRKTSAVSPRPASTAAMIGAIRRSEHPTARYAGRAGLASGPRKLNAVGTPISRRVTEACRRPGWNTGAKQKPIPASSTHRATAGPGSPIATPSASSTSAAPADELAARLPCFATRAPAPAATSADIVDRLTVLARSPPVPTTSSSGPATCTRSPTASIASTRPVCSAGVSPLARSSTANAASWDGDASPAMISAIAQAGVGLLQRLAPQQRAEHRGPALPAWSRRCPTGGPARRGRDRAAAARPSPRRRSGRAGRSSVASASAQVASHRSSRRPSRMHTAGQSSISYFSCRQMPIPPVGWASPSRTATSMPPSSIRATTSSPVAHSTHSMRPRSGAGRRPTAERTCARTAGR
jgi:hypothetical protein